jgi:hypothetical protein
MQKSALVALVQTWYVDIAAHQTPDQTGLQPAVALAHCRERKIMPSTSTAATTIKVAATLVFALALSNARGQALPEGWRASGATPKEYKMTRTAQARYKGEFGASIVHESGSGQGFGTIMQAVNAAPFRGQRVALKAWIRTDDAESAQMWLRIDGASQVISMDNMDDRPIKGTMPWKEYEIVMSVPESATHLAFGVFLSGKGSLAFDEVRIGVAPASARLTTIYDHTNKPLEGPFTPMKNVLEAPSNMSLEK